MSIERLFDDFITLAESNKENKGIWREEPVDLLTFFTSEDFLNETPYPGKQTQLLDEVNQILWWKLTKEEKLCRDDLRKVTEYVGLLGKGSGKDFLISAILAYICYLLCCMNNPQGYFNFGQGEPIDLINVAMNAKQANDVFFAKFRARMNTCKWFRRVKLRPELYNEFQITKNQIRFYKAITAHSAHSEADSFEGFSPLVVIFDEIGGYRLDQAKSCYSTLRSSANSRYNDKILLLFISFPRSMDDFMMQKYNEYLEGKDPEVYGIRGASWEVNLSLTKESFDKDYKTDPEGARTKYETIPPAYRDGFFKFPDRIDQCVTPGKVSQCGGLIIQEKITTRTLNSGEQRHFVGLDLFNLELDPQYTYYLGGDCGVTTDSYMLCLSHGEPVTVETIEDGKTIVKTINKPVEDLILEWRPSKKDRLPVDLVNVADTIEMICKQVFVKKALFDKFNSAEVVQRLMSYGVDAEDKTWSNPFQLQLYSNFKTLVYTSQADLLDYKSPYEGIDGIDSPNDEMKAIKIINGNKITHDSGKYKDFSDARVASFYVCSMDEPADMVHCCMPVVKGTRRRER